MNFVFNFTIERRIKKTARLHFFPMCGLQKNDKILIFTKFSLIWKIEKNVLFGLYGPGGVISSSVWENSIEIFSFSIQELSTVVLY